MSNRYDRDWHGRDDYRDDDRDEGRYGRGARHGSGYGEASRRDYGSSEYGRDYENQGYGRIYSTHRRGRGGDYRAEYDRGYGREGGYGYGREGDYGGYGREGEYGGYAERYRGGEEDRDWSGSAEYSRGTAAGRSGYGEYGRAGYGGRQYGGGYGERGYGRREERGYGGREERDRGEDRGWWERASDEVASWFGDEEAERRRRMDERRGGQHRGRGPKGYSRSDERIREDVNDRLSDDDWLDASDIEVRVENREVTLTGTVNSRMDKRRAEDIAESVSGVTNVSNQLRVNRGEQGTSGYGRQTQQGTTTGTGSVGTTAGGMASGTGSTGTATTGMTSGGRTGGS